MRLKRSTQWVGGGFAALALGLGYYCLILDWQGRPFCHKQIDGAFMEWMGEHGGNVNSHTNAYPNTDGKGAESLAAIGQYMRDMDWARNYRYVPGLRQDDPPDLVLLYLDRPTRWVWHGQPPTVFRQEAWMIIPLDWRPVPGSGELSEQVSLGEFRARLKRTLDFVRTNERPNWQTVVAEHTKFLDSIAQ
jgi:hypothetical protein